MLIKSMQDRINYAVDEAQIMEEMFNLMTDDLLEEDFDTDKEKAVDAIVGVLDEVDQSLIILKEVVKHNTFDENGEDLYIFRAMEEIEKFQRWANKTLEPYIKRAWKWDN